MPLFTSAADTPNDISHLSLHDALPILGAVAHHRDHRLVGIGELGADGRADADAETARAWRAETGPRLLEGHITQDQRIFVDDDRILALGLADAMRRPDRIDRRRSGCLLDIGAGFGFRRLLR